MATPLVLLLFAGRFLGFWVGVSSAIQLVWRIFQGGGLTEVVLGMLAGVVIAVWCHRRIQVVRKQLG